MYMTYPLSTPEDVGFPSPTVTYVLGRIPTSVYKLLACPMWNKVLM